MKQHRQLIARKTIRLAVQDLSRNTGSFDSAKRYIQRDRFIKDCEIAGYPAALLDTLGDMVARSSVQRTSLGREILRVLSNDWDI